ncbi:MAG: 16S rRNA (adenine(1518)-N(6)/adenine(1519)-N(6))-dimethyltransferase RsmA [bacterium]|nr:16S rRNA (adenine(1518)-N(6)/adenine(1519)-N(6))-dimethyltransferase RsmA [bacterium]
MDLSDKTQLINYLKQNGLYTKHALGQNFLVDREVLEKIVETAEIKPDDLVVEVGPGVGTLTTELIKKAGRVVAVEMDDRLAELMSKSEFLMSNEMSNEESPKWTFDEFGFRHFIRNLTFGFRNSVLEVINADILKLNISELTKDNPAYKVVANIPYYITSKILQLFLTAEKKPESITLLVQKEVAERICARAGDMSILAISVQAYAEPEIVGIVKASSFFPAPKVDSAILRIKDIELRIKEVDEKEFFHLVHIGFASKRKTLVNNLAAGLHLDKEKSLAIIKSIGLNENVRAQELSIGEWVKLVQIINLEFKI